MISFINSYGADTKFIGLLKPINTCLKATCLIDETDMSSPAPLVQEPKGWMPWKYLKNCRKPDISKVL